MANSSRNGRIISRTRGIPKLKRFKRCSLGLIPRIIVLRPTRLPLRFTTGVVFCLQAKSVIVG